jgi:hypothetical protein
VAVEPSEPRELTVGEAIALAIQLQKHHHLAEQSSSLPGCSMWRHTIHTLCTTPACWRTNKAEPMKPST